MMCVSRPSEKPDVAIGRTPPGSVGSSYVTNPSPGPSSGSPNGLHRQVPCKGSARSPPRLGHPRHCVVDRHGARPKGRRSGPSETGATTCQWCVRECPIPPPRLYWQDRPRSEELSVSDRKIRRRRTWCSKSEHSSASRVNASTGRPRGITTPPIHARPKRKPDQNFNETHFISRALESHDHVAWYECFPIPDGLRVGVHPTASKDPVNR